ncbi:uncharacterized protein LOC108949777 [Ciona intestinalis]
MDATNISSPSHKMESKHLVSPKHPYSYMAPGKTPSPQRSARLYETSPTNPMHASFIPKSISSQNPDNFKFPPTQHVAPNITSQTSPNTSQQKHLAASTNTLKSTNLSAYPKLTPTNPPSHSPIHPSVFMTTDAAVPPNPQYPHPPTQPHIPVSASPTHPHIPITPPTTHQTMVFPKTTTAGHHAEAMHRNKPKPEFETPQRATPIQQQVPISVPLYSPSHSTSTTTTRQLQPTATQSNKPQESAVQSKPQAMISHSTTSTSSHSNQHPTNPPYLPMPHFAQQPILNAPTNSMGQQVDAKKAATASPQTPAKSDPPQQHALSAYQLQPHMFYPTQGLQGIPLPYNPMQPVRPGMSYPRSPYFMHPTLLQIPQGLSPSRVSVPGHMMATGSTAPFPDIQSHLHAMQANTQDKSHPIQPAAASTRTSAPGRTPTPKQSSAPPTSAPSRPVENFNPPHDQSRSQSSVTSDRSIDMVAQHFQLSGVQMPTGSSHFPGSTPQSVTHNTITSQPRPNYPGYGVQVFHPESSSAVTSQPGSSLQSPANIPPSHLHHTQYPHYVPPDQTHQRPPTPTRRQQQQQQQQQEKLMQQKHMLLQQQQIQMLHHQQQQQQQQQQQKQQQQQQQQREKKIQQDKLLLQQRQEEEKLQQQQQLLQQQSMQEKLRQQQIEKEKQEAQRQQYQQQMHQQQQHFQQQMHLKQQAHPSPQAPPLHWPEGHGNTQPSQPHYIPPPSTQHTQPVKQAPSANAPPQADNKPQNSVDDIFTRYPVIWQGKMALKTESAAVQIHYICGNMFHARAGLPSDPEELDHEKLPVLRIVQRMRLNPLPLEGVSKRMEMKDDYCLLFAVPCGRTTNELEHQTNQLKRSFIDYLKQKQVAGIVNTASNNQQVYVLHVFPPCNFTTENLQQRAPDLVANLGDIQHLMIVITTATAT